ncbi:MAG: SWIM zinc finger family protein [Bryobacterales bacterium]|nr:SWIM zinc finger family protein [Bryobacterales bacterium]
MSFYGWRPYVPVAERRRKAAKELEKRRKKGLAVSPVLLSGRTIATTFWGKAWCENLERYSDYANRLPRGRAYLRNGSVVDLQIASGAITAMVSGSQLYKVNLEVEPVPRLRWKSICQDCAGGIDSLVELLQGRFSKGVMERICRQAHGLFPSPAEIKLSCSCPDWADMCKHVAAVLYGVGARFDHQPELLFRLRAVDEKELIASAGKSMPLSKTAPAAGRILASQDLEDMFGLDMANEVEVETTRRPRKQPAKPPKQPVKKTGARKTSQPARKRK